MKKTYMKRKDHIMILILIALFCLGVGQAWAQSITISEDTESTYVPTTIVNGSFDNEPWMDFVYGGTTYTLSNRNANLQDDFITSAIPNGVNGGWNTTETQFYQGSLFEYSSNERNYNTNLSSTTNHFVEMNVYNSAVLYQDLATHGNDVIRWTLDHAVRTTYSDNIQSVRVEIGAPEYSGTAIVAASGINDDINSHIQSSTKVIFRAAGITNPANATYGFGSNLGKLSLNKTLDSDNKSWHTVTGVYVIPQGQTVTRFGFIAEVESRPDCGNLLDNITFSTLIGNFSAKQLANGDVELKGYWGETDTSKRLKVVIGSTTYDIDMTSVIGKNFRITIPVEMIGLATSVHVYHQDYEDAGRTIEVLSSLNSWPFSYTGTIQTFTAPQAGIYQLRVWGAQGGNRGVGGGLGGYATCLTSLTEGEIIYVYVGGQGGAGSTPAGGAGGWNGGGKGGTGYDNLNGSAGGGGATHISKVNNQVIGNGCTFLGGTDYIIVAGGGGGAGFPEYAGAGGGTEGGLGILCGESHPTYSDHFYYSTNQSYGADGGNGNDGGWNKEGAGGGGGGYYGGTASYPYSTFPTNVYANASGCGGNSAYNSSFGTNFSTTAGQREGNGQAQITLLVSQDEMDEYVGKVLGSDGKMYKTVEAAEHAGVTASGIIAYWGVAGSVEESSSSYRGLAISVSNVAGSTAWCHNSCGVQTTACSSLSDALSKKDGLSCTALLGSPEARNSNGHYHDAAAAAYDYNDIMARPEGSSRWFLPAMGQWNLALKGLTGSSTDLTEEGISDYSYYNNSAKIIAAGGTRLSWSFYRSTTEHDGTYAWFVDFDGSVGKASYQWSKGHPNNMYIRAFFAFSSATPAVYTISYDANGGSGAPAPQTKDGGIDLTLSSTVPTRTGYTFAGWTVAQDGSGTVYAAGTAYDGNEDVILYAQWRENKETLSESATTNSSFITNHAGEVYDITLVRTLQAGGWNTFCVPFNTATPSGWTVRELTGASYNEGTKTLTLNFGNAASIVAGHAYLVKVDAEVATPTFNDVEIVNGTTPTTIQDVVSFVPVMNPTTLPLNDKSCLFVSNGNKLTWAKSGSSMPGFRAYFHIENSSIGNARSFAMSFDDEAMSIVNVNDDENENCYYDLQGRKVNNPTKGIYIVNAKKVVMK